MSISIPAGAQVPLAPASWVAIGDAVEPSFAQIDDFRNMVRAYAKCTADWPGSESEKQYYIDANRWYDLAANVTDGKSLIGVYFDAYVFGATGDLSAWSFSPVGTLLGAKTIPENVDAKSFIDQNEPCGRVKMWLAAGNGAADGEGDWTLQGLGVGSPHGGILVLDAKAVVGESNAGDGMTSGSSSSTASLFGSSTSSGPNPSNAPAPSDSSTRLGTIISIPALIAGVLAKLVVL